MKFLKLCIVLGLAYGWSEDYQNLNLDYVKNQTLRLAALKDDQIYISLKHSNHKLKTYIAAYADLKENKDWSEEVGY